MQELPIYIINLKKSIKRRESLIKEFEKHKISNYNFIEAVNGYHLNLEELKNKNIILHNNDLKRGEIGCSLSHYKIYEEILNKDAEINLILEDDTFFVNGFNNKLNKILNKVLNVEWDIFYLGINCYSKFCKEGEFIGNKINGIYYPKHCIPGTHGYLIKKESIKKIIDSFFPINVAVDTFLMMLDIKRLTLINTIIKTNNSYSETQNIK
jgi:glycosyl transferase family 25